MYNNNTFLSIFIIRLKTNIIIIIYSKITSVNETLSQLKRGLNPNVLLNNWNIYLKYPLN